MFLDKVVFNKTKVPVLNAVLDVTQLRQRVIANNIANVSTNGYRKKDVHFQEYLESFVNKPAVPQKLSLTVFKVPGETNTDDLSPAPDAWSRPDIPLHALAMLKMARDGIEPVEPGSIGPLKQIEEVKAKGFPVAYVGDVVGTGSSRKSATNSVLWFFGDDIPYVPNKRAGGFCFGSKIAPIFYNTMEDAGALPIGVDGCTLPAVAMSIEEMALAKAQ